MNQRFIADFAVRFPVTPNKSTTICRFSSEVKDTGIEFQCIRSMLYGFILLMVSGGLIFWEHQPLLKMF
jgi:hypothetical protein